MKTDLYDLTLPELVALMEGWGEPPYRARQVWNWLYRKLAPDTAEMRSLPQSLRRQLREASEVGRLKTVARQASADEQTEKRLFRLSDGETIETVLMRYDRRNTVCVSSQVGCAMGCLFCATGQMGLRRNLASGEIIAQVIDFDRELRRTGKRVTNVVLMGMGEPLHNYEAVIEAVRRLRDPSGFNLGVRRITISTIGLPAQIRQLALEGLEVGLAISLHGATDDERRRLVPAAGRWSLTELLAAAQAYSAQTGRRITFEWALIDRENDSEAQAHALGRLISGMLCHVNLIPLNPTETYPGRASDRPTVNRFQEILTRYGVETTVRLRRGIDIQAGCGQLRQRVGA